MKALYLDDDPDDLMLTKRVFIHSGLNLKTCELLEDALIELKSEHYDAIIVDNNMYGMSALNMIAIIRGMPQYAETKVVIFTGYAEQHLLNGELKNARVVLKEEGIDSFADQVKKIIDELGWAPYCVNG